MRRTTACCWFALLVVLAGVPATAQGGLRAAEPRGGSFEIESLTFRVSAGQTTVQDMSPFGAAWSGGAQLFWRPPAPVDAPVRNWPHLTLSITPPAGEYDVSLDYTVAPDYGDFRVFLGGSAVADVVGFASGVERRTVGLGRRSLGAGPLQIVVTVFGKQTQSTGFLVGLDRLLLAPVTAAAASAPPAAATVAPPTAAAVRVSPGLRLAELEEPQRAPFLLTAVAGAFVQPLLEVYRDPGGFNDRATRLDWKQPVLRPRFRWKATAEGVAMGVWEIARVPFPSSGGVAPRGLLASGRARPGRGVAGGEFELDLVPYRPQDKRLKLPGRQLAAFDPGQAVPHLYVRLRAIDANGETLGRPSNQIDLFFGKPGKLKLPEKPVNLPRLRLVAYKPPRPFTWDFQCRGVATQELPSMFIKKGQPLDLCKSKSKGLLDHIGDAVGGFVDMVGGVIDFAAGVYNKAKSTAVGAVVEGLKATTGCGSECEWAVGVAVDAGLAAAGIPPSLPEFDQVVAGLEQDGIDALASTMADAAVSQGVPRAAAELAAQEAAKKLVEEAKKAAAGGGGGSGGLWQIDPKGLYSPGVVVLGLDNLDVSRPTEDTDVRLESAFSPGAGLFRFASSRIEPLAPSSSLKISFELQPLTWEAGWMDLLPDSAWLEQCVAKEGPFGCLTKVDEQRKKAKAKLDEWVQAYNGHEHRFRLELSAGGPSVEIAEARCAGNAPTCAVVFEEPRWAGHRVDSCLNWGQQCGAPAAAAFCQRMGYVGALGSTAAPDIGGKEPTRTLGDGKTCSDAWCDGFATITCGPVG